MLFIIISENTENLLKIQHLKFVCTQFLLISLHKAFQTRIVERSTYFIIIFSELIFIFNLILACKSRRNFRTLFSKKRILSKKYFFFRFRSWKYHIIDMYLITCAVNQYSFFYNLGNFFNFLRKLFFFWERKKKNGVVICYIIVSSFVQFCFTRLK